MPYWSRGPARKGRRKDSCGFRNHGGGFGLGRFGVGRRQRRLGDVNVMCQRVGRIFGNLNLHLQGREGGLEFATRLLFVSDFCSSCCYPASAYRPL